MNGLARQHGKSPHGLRQADSASARPCAAATGLSSRDADQARLEPRTRIAASGGAGGGPSMTGDYQTGDKLGGKYLVCNILGRGATGVTYLVRAPQIDPAHISHARVIAVSVPSKCIGFLPNHRHGTSGVPHTATYAWCTSSHVCLYSVVFPASLAAIDRVPAPSLRQRRRTGRWWR